MPSPLRIIFAGTPEFAAIALTALLQSGHEVIAVYTQPDRPAGRGRKLSASPVKQLALSKTIPVYQPESLKDTATQTELAELKPDVMVVAAYGLLLPKAVLELPRYGCLNIHASLLPRWRGAAPIQRAIVAGDDETGVTIMQMDVGLDTGDMLLKKVTPIRAEDTAERLHDRLAQLGAEAIVGALNQITRGSHIAERQDPQLATYAKKLDKAEAVIDWQLSALKIDRLVRAFIPWPVAQTLLQSEILRVWSCEIVNGQASKPAGTILRADNEGLLIACGEDRLRITRAQLPGGKPMDFAALFNGHPDRFTAGHKLG